jgi:hypothetical protein
MVVEVPEGKLRVRIESVDATGNTDWWTVSVEAIYAASPEAMSAVAFTATCDRASTKVDLHANLSKGLLIVASMARFPGCPSGSFSRAFFRKL